MTSLAQGADAMQHVLTPAAEAAAQATGHVRRQRVFSGAFWVQSFVFGCLGTPQPSLTALVQSAAALGAPVTAQALDQRCTATIAAGPAAVPVLRRVVGVSVVDCTSIGLPEALATVWPGRGNDAQPTAATLKLGVRLELPTGELPGPLLAAGCWRGCCAWPTSASGSWPSCAI